MADGAAMPRLSFKAGLCQLHEREGHGLIRVAHVVAAEETVAAVGEPCEVAVATQATPNEGTVANCRAADEQ